MEISIQSKDFTAEASDNTPLGTILSGHWPTGDAERDQLILAISQDDDLAYPRKLPMAQREKFRNFVEDIVVPHVEKVTGMDIPIDVDEDDPDWAGDGEKVTRDICFRYMRKTDQKAGRMMVDNLKDIIIEYLA